MDSNTAGVLTTVVIFGIFAWIAWLNNRKSK
jgi:hypothetical protein